ncbi:DUF6894 family protein [Microvirga sp.]|uniref:DUF6894 family protein n=1 Tax=Microvirga sp. TaxID=1873136 RepID=UPI00391D8CA4
MPRYYIDLRSHFGTHEDTDGVDLPDIPTARAEAMRRAASLSQGWSHLPPQYCADIRVEIIGEDLQPILSIPYFELSQPSETGH